MSRSQPSGPQPVSRSLPRRLPRFRERAPLALLAAVSLCLVPLRLARAQQPSSLPSITAKTTGLVRHEGFIPFYRNDATGTLWLELPRDGLRALMFVTLSTGLGSNPIGLDRGSDGPTYVARFDPVGPAVQLIFENWNYRSSGDSLHRRTVLEAFAPSTVAALPLLASDSAHLLVDGTDLALRDWNDVIGTLTRAHEGPYVLAKDRSLISGALTQAFPRNTEIESELTFAATAAPGPVVSSIVPDGRSFTLGQHLSFVALPDSGYQPRKFDPRTGFGATIFKDYFQPIQRGLRQRWIVRHRLERRDPSDPTSPIVRPIVYYLDPGIPEPIRSAMWEGANWWVTAFERAGLRGAFRVAWLPPGADPMDARYNVVQWENRNERGWSLGGALGDPRTGELIKGMARLDSHRARTDYNIYAAFMGAQNSPADTAFVLARVRQVTAHEVGHTLGLVHNYIASTYGRASVMDYPAPRVRLTGGRIDLTSAYATGPGDFDVFAIHWGYGIFPAAHEADSLRAIVQDGLRRGFRFLSDDDARPAGASDPRTNLWDDGATAEEFLSRQVAVRDAAIARFGLGNIRDGEPVAVLQERFVPLYFWHRFALNAVTKAIGGMEYSFALKGDGQEETRPVPAARQRAALGQVLAALQPAELAIPDTIITLLGPRPGGYPDNVELFRSRTAPAFDELGAARTLAAMVVDGILQRERAARLVAFAGHDARQLTLGETIDALIRATWTAKPASPKLAALQRVTERAVVDRLLVLAADRDASQEVRDMAEFKLGPLARRATAAAAVSGGDVAARAHWAAIAADIQRWQTRRELPVPTPALAAPPGDPFGEDDWY